MSRNYITYNQQNATIKSKGLQELINPQEVSHDILVEEDQPVSLFLLSYRSGVERFGVIYWRLQTQSKRVFVMSVEWKQFVREQKLS